MNSSVAFFSLTKAFSQEMDIPDENSQRSITNPSQINGSSLMLSGRINSMLMPTMADTYNDVMNNSMIMPQIMNNGSTQSQIIILLPPGLCGTPWLEMLHGF